MKKELSKHIFLVLLFVGSFTSAQLESEREHRIRKVQFPEKGLEYIEQNLTDAKRIRYYKEIDSTKISYEVKFKKDRLWYGIEFTKKGAIEVINILVKPVDLPEEAFIKMQSYLSSNFKKYNIRKIQQQYPVTATEDSNKTVKNAFQNLLLPSIQYELHVGGRKEKKSNQYEVLFDAEGNFKSMRSSLPSNYDHVLY